MNIDLLDIYRDCPFCLKLLFEPASTLCGHTFCLLCLECFILTCEQILQCPICRDDLNYLRSSSSHLKPNIILHNLFRQQYENEYELRRIETENERKKIIKKRFIIGNTHQLLSYDDDSTKHQWTLFIKFNNDDDQDNINQYIKQITINLHPTFTPSQIILDEPPFCLKRIGWGVFTIYLTIQFQPQWKKSDFRTILFTVQKALSIFVDGGSIIFNASVGSIKTYPNESVYSASKAAVRSFARCWTVDLKERHIRVNAVSPGPIDTPILRNTGNIEEEQQAYIDGCAAATTMIRIGTPNEVAKAVMFLASEDSSYITGIELFVDGGMAQI